MPKKDASLEIYLLGPFRILVDGQLVAARRFTRRKPKLLVKLLALRPHHQLHREQLMELLWPDSDPEAASNNLHKTIHLARHALEPTLKSAADSHFILTEGQQVSLRADKLCLDVNEFELAAGKALRGAEVEAYEAALERYAGDLLPEDLYEDWVAVRREQLRMTYQDLLRKSAQLYKERGENHRAIERLKELLACDPAHEDVHRNLMELYAISGNKHQALRQYELCREALREGLEAEPEPATRELRQQIVTGQFASVSVSAAERELDHVHTINSLAVLPLVNATSDPNAEYLSDGITESIINSLSQLPQLKVMSRNTVFRYKGREIDSSQVGRELNVRTLLLGRVLQLGDRLVVRAELIDVDEGTQLWGEQYNRRGDDIFELQEEIASEIAEKLRLRLSGAEKGRLTKRYTENAEAYGLYLKGRYFWNKRTLEAVEKGIEYFKRAIELDPDYALAYVGVADSYTKLGDVGVAALPPRKAFSKAKMAAVRALESDSALAEAHTSLGHLNLHDYEWSEAEREFKHAIELNPNYATAHHWYAYHLLMNGRQTEAINEIEHALSLDPLSLPINADYGEVLYFARRRDEAIEQLRKTLEMDPHFYPAHSDLARVYEQEGRYEEAIIEIQTALALSPESTDGLATLAHIYAASGKEEQALHLLEELSEVAKSRYVSPYGAAVVYAALGEEEHAFKWLQTATEEHAAWVLYLNVDPRLDSLRAEPRFKSLLHSVGLSESSHE